MITSLDEEKNFTTVKKSPDRIFQCVPEQRVYVRKDVWKMGGVYTCPKCGKPVVDVTKTHAKDLINIGI